MVVEKAPAKINLYLHVVGRRADGYHLLDSLVAFAWESVLGMVAGLAAAVGKDARGNLLVPAEMTVSPAGLVLLPMARHRFAGGSGLKTTTPATTTRVTVSPIDPRTPTAPVKSGAAWRRSAR